MAKVFMSALPDVSTRTWNFTLNQPFRSVTPLGILPMAGGVIARGAATFSTSMLGLASARLVASRQSPRAMGASRLLLIRAPTISGSGCVSGDFLEHAGREATARIARILFGDIVISGRAAKIRRFRPAKRDRDPRADISHTSACAHRTPVVRAR